MNPLISIIVPIYNAEKYLSCCVDSILNQTFKNFELLLIDDGSTDRSGEICDKYAQLDMRIKVIHKPNTGVSDARNCALDIATGKYVIFMDADDFWTIETALEQLFNIAEENDLDIIRGEYDTIDEQGNLYHRYLTSKSQIKYINRLLSPYEFLKYAVHGEFFLWLCLFRRDAINSLRFECGLAFLEDMQFLSKLMIKNIRSMYVPEMNFYIYRINSNSVSNRFLPQRIRNILTVSDTIYDLSKKTKDNLLRFFFIDKSIYLFYLSLSYMSLDEYYIYRNKYIKEYNLEKVRIRTKRRILENKKIVYSPVFYVNVAIGLRILRLCLVLAKKKHFLQELIYRNLETKL